MESLLTPLWTSNESVLELEEELLAVNTKPTNTEHQIFSLNTPEAALEALKSKPDRCTLGKVLRWLTLPSDRQDVFNIKKPGPKAAEIIYVLVNDIVPDYWTTLSGDDCSKSSKEKRLLLRCLSSVAGMGAITSRLRILIGLLKESKSHAKLETSNKDQPLEEILDVIKSILGEDTFTSHIWNDINACVPQSPLKSLQWKEFLSLIASGKVLSLTSEATITLNDVDSSIKHGSWVGDGNQYAFWLGRNIQHMLRTLQEHDLDSEKAVCQLFKKALTLGYTDQIVQSSFSGLMNGDDHSTKSFKRIMLSLAVHEQKTLLYTITRHLSSRLLSPIDNIALSKNKSEDRVVGGLATLLVAIIHDAPSLQDLLVDWLIGTSAEAAGQSHKTHRAVIAALSHDSEQAKRALQKAMELFGDKLYIKHTPILHQEVNAQLALMLAGYVYRVDKNHLASVSRSSVYLNAISNRLSASSERARFLGMIVGNAISELVDPEDKRMNFSSEDMGSSDGKWYKSLTSVKDSVGSIGDLKPPPVCSTKPRTTRSKPGTSKGTPTKATASKKATSKIISIEEINDSLESETEDLPMYEKPGSDPSDEDEDPTLVQRDRPTAPVYVSDLIAGLRDTENFDRHKLALSTASSLIRRKTSFGTEVLDNIEELARLLVGLSDRWEINDFQKLRLQGMIAVLTAEPLKMGQWFSMIFYNGDFSMGQRASVLTALGLGAREIAGLGKEDATLTGVNTAKTSFPSKRLPDKLHKLYALEAAPMDTISQQLERTMIQPMAAEVADKVTGPNALKVRTFSSRMAVEKKRRKPIPNALAKIVVEGFFFPLTGRWRIHIQSYGESTSHTSPFLLSHLLKTLSLILHASGPSTLSLPLMTCEFWSLLLSLRPRAADPSILEALLFAFMTLLDINENDQRRLAEEHAKELLETERWVEAVFERVGGGSLEGDRIRMLAAGVLMRTRKCVERYQRVLMGDLVDSM